MEGLGLGPPLAGEGHLSITIRGMHLDLGHREGSLTDGTVHTGFVDLRADGPFKFRGCGPLRPEIFCLLHIWISPVLYLLLTNMLSSKLAASTSDVSLCTSVPWSFKQSQIGFGLFLGVIVSIRYQYIYKMSCRFKGLTHQVMRIPLETKLFFFNYSKGKRNLCI